ncbi:MAG: hypothetical protein U9N51_00950, partial [Bacteroidota bacterium]|nr:hypothetical protein [Bacteroidota bacterium]
MKKTKIHLTGESATQIRDNTFNNISGASNVSAAIVMGKNSDFIEGSYVDIGETGTEFRCNNFSQNTYAMSIVDGNMRKYQGEHNASSGEDYAGNEFDHYGTSTERDFYVDQNIASYLDIPLYEYYSHADDAHKILHFTGSKINNLGQTDDYINDDCTEDSGGGGIVIKGKSVGESIGDIETLDSEITLKSFELSELTDNGETYIMLSEVENASTTNSTEVATELSELDGFISDEVTLTYIQNSATGEFDKAGALLANSPLPSAAKNEIDNMEMNSTLKTIIKAGQNGKNSREIKEAEIAGLKQTRGLIVKEMVNRVMTNDSLQSERNELISFLQNDNTFTSKIHLLNLYKAKKNNAAIETRINNLRTQIHSFNVDRLTELENYLDLQELVLNIDNGLFSMENAVNQNMEFLQN